VKENKLWRSECVQQGKLTRGNILMMDGVGGLESGEVDRKRAKETNQL
jgi:hypothetical protein